MGVRYATAVATALLSAASGTAEAQDPVHDTAILNGSAFSNSQGVIAVNAVAGANNQQANVAVIAQGETSIGSAVLIQFLETVGPSGERQMSALITDGAFANSSGLIAVNVAAGADNQQGNLALLSLGSAGGAVADVVLSQSRASPGGSSPGTDPVGLSTGHTQLSPDAFENSSGVAQISIIGGERNSSSNVFALSLRGGANP